MSCVGTEEQLPEVSVNVKLAEPAEIPVTTPLLLMVATETLLLLHVPPVEGKNVVVVPIQISGSPDKNTFGLPFTVNGEVGFDTHPEDCVNIKVTIP